MNLEKSPTAPAPVRETPPREIPPLPGGGSWRFDEARWEWIDNNPQPEPAAQPNQE